jgi:hypothetical protein
MAALCTITPANATAAGSLPPSVEPEGKQTGIRMGQSMAPAPWAVATSNDQSEMPASPVCMPTRTR